MSKNFSNAPRQIVHTAGLLVLGMTLVTLTPVAAQAQWTYEPIAKVGVETDDNATLSIRTDDVRDVTGILYNLSLRLDYKSPLTSFFITPEVLVRKYSDDSDLNSNDIFVASVFRRDMQSSMIRVRFDFDEQTARTAERADADLDVDDPDDIPDDDTGRVAFQGDRQRIRIRPEWYYEFSNAMSLRVEMAFIDTSYDEILQPFLSDYTDAHLAVSLNRAFTERTTGIVTARGRNYELSDGSSETTGIGLLAGFESSLSQTSTLRAMFGVEDVDSDISETDPNFVADVSFRRRLETVNFLAQYRRSISASGSGKLSVRDSINLNLSRRLSEKVTAGLGVRTYQTNSVDDVLTIDERTYVQLRAQFTWNITTNFATEFDYRYTFQDRSVLGESSNSNQVTVWFAYKPNSIDRRFR